MVTHKTTYTKYSIKILLLKREILSEMMIIITINCRVVVINKNRGDTKIINPNILKNSIDMEFHVNSKEVVSERDTEILIQYEFIFIFKTNFQEKIRVKISFSFIFQSKYQTK